MSVYTIRVDRDYRGELLERLKYTDSVICMGWGGGDSGLNLDVRGNEYEKNFQSCYSDVSKRIRNNIKNKILALKENDILLIPNLPSNGNVIIGIASKEPYSYVLGDETHLNHRIHLKTVYGLTGNISTKATHLLRWSAKLWTMRLPIYPNYLLGDDIEEFLGEIKENIEGHFTASTLDEFLETSLEKAIDFIYKEIGEKTRPSKSEVSFEGICKKILISYGYAINGENIYNKKGADVDFSCSRPRREISPFEQGDSTLYVQVKKHYGETDVEAVRQLTLALDEDSNIEAQGCVMSLADSFTLEAQELSENQGIVLINGRTLCKMLISIISNPSDAIE